MNANSPGTFITELKDIARSAGQAITRIRAGGAEVEKKADGSPVTEADKTSHRIITERLKVLSPSYPIISEEGNPEQVLGEDASRYWLVDPLDGTKEFVKGLPEYTVNIALVEEGDPLLGVILIPESGVLYHAVRNKGAWKSEPGNSSARRINAKSSTDELTAVISRSHSGEETERLLEELEVQDTKRRGSSLKICAVAEGAADIYVRPVPTYLWDTAAGTAILRQAGGYTAGLPERAYDPTNGLKLQRYAACATEEQARRVDDLLAQQAPSRK